MYYLTLLLIVSITIRVMVTEKMTLKQQYVSDQTSIALPSKKVIFLSLVVLKHETSLLSIPLHSVSSQTQQSGDISRT